MANFWNQINLPPPPYSTCKTNISYKDLNRLTSTLNYLSQFSVEKNQIYTEATLLSRIIYRMKLKYRFEKGFKCMQKTHRALRIFLNYPVNEVLNSFFNLIDLNIENASAYLPTRQNLQYVLVRLQGFVKLLCRIVNSCDLTIDYLQKRMNDGFWTIGLLSISVCCRISIIAKYMADRICTDYNTLYSFYPVLELKGVDWLPSDYQLPENLKDWLNESWLYNKDISLNSLNNAHKVKKIELNTNNFSNIQSANFVFNNQPSNQSLNVIDNSKKTISLNKPDIDMGVSVSRETMPLINRNVNQMIKNSFTISKEIIDQNHSINSSTKAEDEGSKIHNVLDIDSFVKVNETYDQKSKIVINVNKEISNQNDSLQLNTKAEKNRVKTQKKSLHIHDSLETGNKKYKHSVKSIACLNDLEKFIEMERKYRENSSKKCVTKKFDLLQWNIFQNMVFKYIKKIKRNQKEKVKNENVSEMILKKAKKSIRLSVNC